MHGDILHQFIMLLECRLDTLLYRSGMVASIFEARQLINHKNVLVNNNIITKRSYVINNTDIVMFVPFFLSKKKKDILSRIYKHGFVFYPPVYLEVNYKFFMILFLFDILKAQQVPFNFKLTGYDINNILYYYY
jgi:ribosomal protein S4